MGSSRGGEMVDAHVSGTCEAIHGGSSPLLGTFGITLHLQHDSKYIVK